MPELIALQSLLANNNGDTIIGLWNLQRVEIPSFKKDHSQRSKAWEYLIGL